MATNAATLKVTASVKEQRPARKSAFSVVRDWARKGQLGASNSIEMSRYTGGRI